MAQSIAPQEEEEDQVEFHAGYAVLISQCGQAWACLECGARYHMDGQVSGCSIMKGVIVYIVMRE